MAEFEQTESTERIDGESPIRGLYNVLKADKDYGQVFGKYTPIQFEAKLKSNKDAAAELRGIAISKGLYKTDKDFDAAIFGVKPAAAPATPAQAKPAVSAQAKPVAPKAEEQPKQPATEEKGWIRTALTEGVPGLTAKFASTPLGQSLGSTVKQTGEMTGEPVKKKEGTGLVYGENKRTPLDDYEQIQQEYIDADKEFQTAKSKANRTPRELALGETPQIVSPDIVKARDEKRRKSEAILAKSEPEIENWVETIVGNPDKKISAKVSLTLDPNEKTTLPRGLYKNNAGIVTVDDAVTDKFAKEEVEKRGLPENGVVYRLLKNALDRRFQYEVARPHIEKAAKENFFKKYGISMEDAGAKDFANQLGGTESEQMALNMRTKDLAKQIGAERDVKIGEVTNRLKSLNDLRIAKMDKDEEGLAAYNAVRQDLFNRYQDLVNKGELTVEQANQYLNSDQANEAANRARNEVLKKKYGAEMKKDYDQYLSSFGNINARYKARYDREAKEAEVIANAKLDKRVAELKAKYKPSDAFIAKYRKSYEDAAKQYFGNKEYQEAQKEAGAGAVDRITRGILSSFGEGLKGLGQSFGTPDVEKFGDVLASNFKGGNLKIKPGAAGWAQALNPFDPAAQQSFGQLIGRMAPSLAASAAVGAATGGLGLPTLGSAIAAGFTGGVMETADIVGTMYNDILEQTGSHAAATQAANAAFKSQMQIAPVYAFDAFAFFPKLWRGTKFGKNAFGRAAAGAGTEYVTEMLQELPQNVYEELIRKGIEDNRPYDPTIGSMLGNINLERINETGKQLTGTLLLGGAPSLFSDTKEGMSKVVAKRAAQAYYAKNILTDSSHPALILQNQGQFLEKAFDSKGKNFANALIGTFLINGNLTKGQAEALTTRMENYEKYNERNAQLKRGNISPAFKQAEFDLFNDFMIARASKNEEAIDAAYQKYQNFLNGKGADLLMVHLADGSTNVYSFDDFDSMLDNENMQRLIRDGGVEITSFSQDPNNEKLVAINQKLQGIAEVTPEKIISEEQDGLIGPDDNKILEGQQRTGYQIVSPLANLPEEVQAALQAATDNQEGFDPQAVKAASNYLYRLYNITMNTKKSTSRNLTKAQIADQMEELGTALDLLGNYYNRLATGEMEINEQVEAEEAVPTEQQPAPQEESPSRMAPPAPGTPQVRTFSDDDVIAQMTDEERQGYYNFIADGDIRRADFLLGAVRQSLIGARGEIGEVMDAARTLGEAMKTAGITVSVIENEDEYNKIVEQYGGNPNAASSGMFFGDDGKIFINRPLLRANWGKTVVFHEGTHPILNIIRNTNPELYYKVVNGLKKASIKNKQIESIMKEAAKGLIDPARIDDESVTETFAQIADGKLDLSSIPSTLKDAIVELLNKIAAAFGLPQIKVSDVMAFKKLAKDVSAVLKGNKKLEEVVGKDNIKEYQDKIGESRGQARRTTPYKGADKLIEGFYSPLERTIEETKFDKLPAKQWIDKFGGSEEAKWTGLRDWLEKQTGSLSKQELLDFMKDNRVEVSVVAKGEENWKEAYRIRYKEILDGAKELREYGISLDQIEGKKDLEDDDWGKLPKNIQEKFTELAVLSGFLDEAKRNVGNSREVLAGYDKAPKFSDYQLPGKKENYKEVLVTLPTKGSVKPEWGVYDKNGRFVSKHSNENNAKKKSTDIGGTYKQLESFYDFDAKQNYKSRHWDEPNVLVHLRMNTRTDADGNKVLFLEEVQSDWGQEGRKEGFVREGWLVKDYFDQVVGSYKTEQEAKQAAKDLGGNAIKGRIGIAPTAPFVMDTNAWVKLGLKTALQEAVRQGADKIAWATGEQQNDRYDLSKQVEYIDYWKNDNGTYGFALPTEFTKPSELTASELENYLGKEVTKKIVEDTSNPTEDKPKRLQGDDLKVGGKGMKGFYGSMEEGSKGIIGGVAEKLFGQKVGEVRINKAKFGGIKQKGWVINIEGDIYEKQFDSKKEAEDFVETPKFQRDVLGYEYVIKENPNIDLSTQPSISITPAMKAQVEKGLPQFRRASLSFSQIDDALNLSPVKSREARAALIEEYGKETVDKMIEITRNFEKIIDGLEEEGVVKKDCP